MKICTMQSMNLFQKTRSGKMHQVVWAIGRDCLNSMTWIVLVMTLIGHCKALYCKQMSCVTDFVLNHHFLVIYFEENYIKTSFMYLHHFLTNLDGEQMKKILWICKLEKLRQDFLANMDKALILRLINFDFINQHLLLSHWVRSILTILQTMNFSRISGLSREGCFGT